MVAPPEEDVEGQVGVEPPEGCGVHVGCPGGGVKYLPREPDPGSPWGPQPPAKEDMTYRHTQPRSKVRGVKAGNEDIGQLQVLRCLEVGLGLAEFL